MNTLVLSLRLAALLMLIWAALAYLPAAPCLLTLAMGMVAFWKRPRD